VARGATSRDPRVIEFYADREAHRARMAHLAGSDGRYVVRGLSSCRDTVVTSGAATGDAGMVELGRDRKACRARMAHLARRGGGDVVRWLAHRNHAGVACCARCRVWNVRVVDTSDVAPHGRLMTRLALLVRGHVIERLARDGLVIVAVKTQLRSRQNRTRHVARRADKRRMASGKRISSRRVIERLVGSLRLNRSGKIEYRSDCDDQGHRTRSEKSQKRIQMAAALVHHQRSLLVVNLQPR